MTHSGPGTGHRPGGRRLVLEPLGEAECLELVSGGGIGRIAYSGRRGLTVFPVNYVLHQGAVLFRTAGEGPTGEDLRTGIAHAEYRVAFEVDDIDPVAHEGWSVLIQGPAHHMTTADERAAVSDSGVEPWPSGARELAIRITPTQVTGRRLRRAVTGAAETAPP